MDEVLLTAAEVAARLRLHPRTIANMVKRGELPAAKIGRTWKFKPSDVETYIAKKQLSQAGGDTEATAPNEKAEK